MRNIKLTTNGAYFTFMALLYVVSPIMSLAVALMLYKRTVSQFFFIAFAFYFGYQLGPNLDLMEHWRNYESFIGNSFFDMYQDLGTLYLGKEPFHIVFKYVLAQFDVSSRTFSGIACATYTTVVVCFVRQFNGYYNQKKTTGLAVVMLMLMVVTVEFYWYFGIRFWTGVFVFVLFYSKYIITGKKKFLLLTTTCLLFHVVLVIALFGVFLIEVTRDNRMFQYILLAISFIYKYIEYGMVGYLSSFDFVKLFYKSNVQSIAMQRSMHRRSQFLYEHGNVVYQSRIPLMLITFFAIIVLLWSKNKNVTKAYPKLFGAVLIMIAIANFGHSEITFYERFLKLACLLAYTYLFLILYEAKNMWLSRSLFVRLILFLLVIFSLVVALYQERMLVDSIYLWFGNFFTLVPIQSVSNY